MAFGGIDSLIQMARDAQEAFDSDAEEVLHEVIDILVDRQENRALSRYLAHCRTEAREAMRAFAVCDPRDEATVLALHAKIADYYRVALYVSEQIGSFTDPDQEDDILVEDEIGGDTVGEPEYGEENEGVQPDARKPQRRHRRSRRP